ncbi:uncharacterized protein LOC143888834 [Tasmannia lanceolata]|uniref:uncharacterized protein LOC143888834 n=1 Tax=Tasmannia lanceolata TaxID=3420 RepID=UPI00406452DA
MTFLRLEDSMNQKNMKIAENFRLVCFKSIRVDQFCSWIKPTPPIIKVNTDAAVQNGSAGLGGLAHDSAGKVLHMFSIRHACEEIHILELKAILHGIRLAKSKNILRIWIESDSLTAVNVIKKIWACPWKAIPVVADIREALSPLHQWDKSHVWREANSAADFLSKPDCSYEGDDIPGSTCPPSLKKLLISMHLVLAILGCSCFESVLRPLIFLSVMSTLLV